MIYRRRATSAKRSWCDIQEEATSAKRSWCDIQEEGYKREEAGEALLPDWVISEKRNVSKRRFMSVRRS